MREKIKTPESRLFSVSHRTVYFVLLYNLSQSDPKTHAKIFEYFYKVAFYLSKGESFQSTFRYGANDEPTEESFLSGVPYPKKIENKFMCNCVNGNAIAYDNNIVCQKLTAIINRMYDNYNDADAVYSVFEEMMFHIANTEKFAVNISYNPSMNSALENPSLKLFITTQEICI